MNRSLIAGALTAAALAVSPQAHADWRSTKWSMTPDEVLKCENGEIAPTDDVYNYGLFKGQNPFGVIASKKIGEETYTVIFNKDDNGKFSSVLLKLSDDRYAQIRSELVFGYGAPAYEQGGLFPKAQWRDTAKGNAIKLSRLASTVVEYTPLVNDGL